MPVSPSPFILPTPNRPPTPSYSCSPGDSTGSTTPEIQSRRRVAAPDASGRPPKRVSIACLACRSRHLKCNATRPRCSRCIADDVECSYAQSRRRGHRRSPLLPAVAPWNKGAMFPLSRRYPSLINPDRRATPSAVAGVFDPSHFFSMSSSTISRDNSGSLGVDEGLIGLYYTYFHPDQPCCLPRWALSRYCATDHELLAPILFTMQYIGSLFDSTAPSSLFREAACRTLPLPLSSPSRSSSPSFSPDAASTITPYQVQAMLLYGTAVYWCDEVEHGLAVLAHTVDLALGLGMHRAPFAARHGRGDAVLEESWRRTWWMVYVTDGLIAGMLTHSFPTRTGEAGAASGKTVAGLPCEEDEYESGNIPKPRTLDDFDVREFLPDDDPGFSSFSQLIGVTRTLDLIMSRNIPLAGNLSSVCSQVDISLSAWCSLLPSSKRQCLTSSGEMDRHLFKANMLINTYVVNLHRQLSDLTYSAAESIAGCRPLLAHRTTTAAAMPHRNAVRLHRAKALVGIRRLFDLLALPLDLLTHTPFLICMVANTMAAHLSAYRRHIVSGKGTHKAKDALPGLERERIRSCMASLRVLGEIWPLGRRAHGEMGDMARDVLGLSSLSSKNEPGTAHPQLPETASPAPLPTPATSDDCFYLPDMPLDIGVGTSDFLDFEHVSQGFHSYDAFPSLADVCQR